MQPPLPRTHRLNRVHKPMANNEFTFYGTDLQIWTISMRATKGGKYSIADS
ncbi:predicted protein [Sclerotinia sclerotiorum 1980 UF-70]|uniref:Uncharacterized protein n=1 Tax=Sclerotinia sclerotiorum (strain ATCC 18683 / 1980 / Ss-1) TaxID=665079 RepID=A7EA83_SCLS1|nr:predicted protein [Sclerotinia sclerotiorum 1980 UF-70]EDN99361.1 predicted protein [Sclerotinia sclerotiorum 1980 UF-70]